MYSIDFKDQLNEYLLDENRKIPKAHLDTACCPYHKEKTCRYMALSRIGYVCMKKSPAKNKLDEMVKKKEMVAQGNNCEGLGNIDKLMEKENL